VVSRAIGLPAVILACVPYVVATPVFEGPFDLLLHLVTKQEVDIWEVSISSIVDEYVAALEQMRAVDLDVATEFLLIAAILLELKARRLLPGREDVEPEEELALFEERDLLLTRLLECKTFKGAAGAIAALMGEASRSRPRVAGPDERYSGLLPDVLEGVGPEDLRDQMARLLAPRPVTRVLLDHVAPIRASVADAVAELARELAGAGRVPFSRIAGDRHDRLKVVVRFLAVLELCKQGLVELDQAGTFAELWVTWAGGDEPLGEPILVDDYSGVLEGGSR
jgi:segregation and condensation protein A